MDSFNGAQKRTYDQPRVFRSVLSPLWKWKIGNTWKNLVSGTGFVFTSMIVGETISHKQWGILVMSRSPLTDFPLGPMPTTTRSYASSKYFEGIWRWISSWERNFKRNARGVVYTLHIPPTQDALT